MMAEGEVEGEGEVEVDGGVHACRLSVSRRRANLTLAELNIDS